MKLEHFEAHLNELLHDLASPLNSMRLQLGLILDAAGTDERLVRRVQNTERQVVRAQQMIDAFVSACLVTRGRCIGGEVVRRVLERFRINATDSSGEASVALEEEALGTLTRTLAEASLLMMAPESPRATILAEDDELVVRVEGEFDLRTGARAMRLSFVDADGQPELSLARSRLFVSAARGTLLLERGALVMRLPLVSE